MALRRLFLLMPGSHSLQAQNDLSDSTRAHKDLMTFCTDSVFLPEVNGPGICGGSSFNFIIIIITIGWGCLPQHVGASENNFAFSLSPIYGFGGIKLRLWDLYDKKPSPFEPSH